MDRNLWRKWQNFDTSHTTSLHGDLRLMAISGSYARLHNLLTKLRCLLTRVEGEDGYFEKDLEHEPDTVVLQVARNLAKHFVAINGLLPARCRVDGTYLHNTFERWLWKSGDWEFMNLVTNELKHFWVSVTAPARRAVFKKWPPHHFAYIGFVDDLSPFNSRIRIRPSYFIEDMYCRTVCVLNDMHVIRTWTEENILLNYSFLIWF